MIARAAAILVVAFAIRLVFVPVVDLPLSPGTDPQQYYMIAESISRGDGYPPSFVTLKAKGADNPSAARPPAYPVFLAAVMTVVGHNVDRVRAVQVLLGTLLVALIGLVATQLCGTRIGLWAMAIAAIYPPFWAIGTTLMSEALLLPLLLAAVAATIQQRKSEHKLRWAVAVGVLVGLMALTRANALLVVLPLAIAVWPRAPSLRSAVPALVLVLATITTLAPWSIRNLVVLDAFVPLTTQSGFLLAGTYNPTSAADSDDRFAWRPVFLDPESDAYLQRQRGRLGELEIDRALRRRAFDYIAEHPLSVPEAMFWNTIRMAGFRTDWDQQYAPIVTLDRHRWLGKLTVTSFWLLAALAILGIVCARGAPPPPLFVAVVPLLLVITALVATNESRFRLPLDAFLILPVAALAGTTARLRRGTRSVAPLEAAATTERT